MIDHVLPLVEKSLRNFADDVAVRHDGTELTYAALDRSADAAAWQLKDAGVQPGDRVALLLGNTPDYLVFDLALLRAGATKVPLNPMLAGPELCHIVEHSASTCLVTNAELADRIDRRKVDGLRGGTISVGSGLFRDAPVDGGAPVDGQRFPSSPAAPEDVAVIYYTGGTTGRPKGVVHTHASVAANMLSHVIEGDIRRREQMLVTTPLSHSAGLFSMAGLIMGATVTVHPGFRPEALRREVRDGHATWTFLVPTMIYRLLDEIVGTGDRLAGLETIVYGASPITPHRLAQALAGIDAGFIQLYGQTECPNFGTTLDKREHRRALTDDTLMSSCGKASTMADVAIVVGREPAGPGEIGEVCLRSPYLMAWYLDDPEATAAAIVDGWLHTGDLGTMDHRGYVSLKDRRKDMIISGGMNVYPAEVEATLQRLDGVAQVAIIGIPHDTWGESVCAFVVRQPGSDLDDRGVLDFARTALATYKRPKDVRFLDALPLTAVGKVDKKALRAPFWPAVGRQIG
ncbi:MAG TPA: AMP-binding protein [Acidimicrobiales bacterium]|nr:AMP-binding protein [Acidimicrobiales bacterium]